MLQKSTKSLFHVDCDRLPLNRISHLSGHEIIVPTSSVNRVCTVYCVVTYVVFKLSKEVILLVCCIAADQADRGHTEGRHQEVQHLHIRQQEGRPHRQYQCALRNVGNIMYITSSPHRQYQGAVFRL